MPHHSFERTLTYDDNLDYWLSSGASMALRDRVQLLPPVADRYAVFYNKKAIGTGMVDIQFTISGSSQQGASGQDGAVALWLERSNYTEGFDQTEIVKTSKQWIEGLTKVGHTLLAHKPNFLGLAIVFGFRNGRQTITTMSAESDAKPTSLDDVPAENVHYVDWLSAGTQVKIRAKSDGSVEGYVMTLDMGRHISGSVWGWSDTGDEKPDGLLTLEGDGKVKWNDGVAQGSWKAVPGNRLYVEFNGRGHTMHFEGSNRAREDRPSQAEKPEEHRGLMLYGAKVSSDSEHWEQFMSAPPGFVKDSNSLNFYCGFTGYSGSKSFIEVDLHRMETKSFDEHRMGEDMADVVNADQGEWMKVLAEDAHYLASASQAEAVLKLNKLLSDHTENYDRQGEQLKEDLVRMDGRLDVLGRDIANFLSLAKVHKGGNTFDAQELKDHIVGIRATLAKDKELHDAKLHVVHQAARDLKVAHSSAQLGEEGKAKVEAVADQSKSVETFAARGSFITSGLLLAMVLAVAGLGLLFLNRMRYYEKKHYI